MLTDFYFDENVFADDSLKNSTVVNDVLLDSWRDYGRLAYSESGKIREILNSVPAPFRQRWGAHLANCSVREIDIDPDELYLSATFNEVTNIFSDKEIYAYIIAKGNHSLILGNAFYQKCNKSLLEVFTPSETTASNFYTSGRLASEDDLHSGISIDYVWDTRFKGLVKYTNKISIIDRYLVKNLFEDFKAGKVTSVEKFMEFVFKDSKSSAVNIVVYSSDAAYANGNCNQVKIESYLKNVLTKKPYVNKKLILEINICADSLFAEYAHDRQVAFEHHVVQIGSGMEIFRDGPIKTTTFNVKSIIRAKFGSILGVFSKNRLFCCSTN